MSQQLPLALRAPPDQRLETFVGSEAIVAAIRACALGAGGGAVLLTGPSGAGKTHLLLSACVLGRGSARRAAYLGLADARGRLAERIDGLECNDLLAIDGLEHIAGVREDEVALFHLHNRCRDAGCTLLYASRSPLQALLLQLPDLRSRLGQAVSLPLMSLDDDGRRELLRQRAGRRGLQLDEAVLDYLFKRVGRDLSGLTALFEQLDQASLASQRRITVPLVREVLGK